MRKKPHLTDEHYAIRDLLRKYRKQNVRPPKELRDRWHRVLSEGARAAWTTRKVKLETKTAAFMAVRLRQTVADLERRLVSQVERLAKKVRGTWDDPKYAAFYKTPEWKKLRYLTNQRWQQVCMCCGARPPSAIMCVDHIVPVRVNWSKRLDPENLQILCGTCNEGKGNRDDTDFRRPAFAREPFEL